MKDTIGIRLADDKIPTKPGEYSLLHRQNGEEAWVGCPPKEGLAPGTFSSLSVVLHEDGTITVSVLITYNKNYPEFPQWSGYLVKGFWREE